MGKLAERLADAQRSGIYRIESTGALEEAAALNGFALERIALGEAPAPALAAHDGRVLLFSGFEAHARNGALAAILGELEEGAKRCREQGGRFFAVFLDPAGLLPLAPLYNWQRRRGQRGE